MHLKPCPECGSDDVEICSGDAVLCNECGCSWGYEHWQAERPPKIEAQG